MTGPAVPSQDVINAFVAAAHGDFDQVKALLGQYPTLLNASASWGETALGAAAQTAQVEIAEHLLAQGAPLDICTAAMLGWKDRVEQLLATAPGGANATGAHGLPLLYHAVITGQAGIAALLVAHGADVNAGAGHTTPLHGAVMFNQPEMAHWLLEHGADPNPLNQDGQTALDLAVALKRERVARVLREHGGRA